MVSLGMRRSDRSRPRSLFGALENWGREFEDVFAEVEKSFGLRPLSTSQDLVPSCDIRETEKAFLMSLDLPGLKKDDIDVEVGRNSITISGERKQAFEEEKGTIHKSCLIF
ncbi:MAG: Hsp20/alpha crystallin family protein [Oligoflexales bacterium]